MTTYAEALTTFRDLLDDDVNSPHYSESEYVRGGVALMADMFGVKGMSTGERTVQIMRHLNQIPQFTPPQAITVLDDGEISIDTYGVLNPKWDGKVSTRFTFSLQHIDPTDEPAWQYKIELADHKYLDSDGLPITAIAGGETYKRALVRTGEMIEQALATPSCIF